MIQGPNRLSPVRHPERARKRRDWVLGRLEELGWASPEAVRRAKDRPIRLRLDSPTRPPAAHFVDWVESVAQEEARRRLAKGRGVVAETSLDPGLQRLAEATVAEAWPRLAKGQGGEALGIALVALDAETVFASEILRSAERTPLEDHEAPFVVGSGVARGNC